MMKYFKLLIIGLLLGTCSCAQFGTYLENRALDLVDPFMLRVGYGAIGHASVQVTRFGPSAIVGISAVWQKVGFVGREYAYSSEYFAGIGLAGIRIVLPEYRSKASEEYFANFREYFMHGSEICFNQEIFFFGDGLTDALGFTRSNFFMRGELPPKKLKHLFWIEAEVCLLADINVGFNPYEFADFMLGFFTIDISGDDKKVE